MSRIHNVSKSMSLSLVMGVVLAACAPAAPAVDTAATEEAMQMAETEAAKADEMHMAETEAAEEAMLEVLPSVTTVDQEIEMGHVTVAEVVSDGPGWMAIHAQAEDGGFGEVLGYTAVSDGVNTDVVVDFIMGTPTETLFAMLHIDAGEVGTYEFPGDDVPYAYMGGEMAGQILAPPFQVLVAMVEYTVELGGTDALGEFLVVGTGMAKGLTLYTFANDTEGKSTCTGDCATTWPPLLVEEGEPTASMDVPGSLGVYERMEDGGRQLTYNGMPLYYFSGDSAPGDTNGQGLGGVWFVAAP